MSKKQPETELLERQTKQHESMPLSALYFRDVNLRGKSIIFPPFSRFHRGEWLLR